MTIDDNKENENISNPFITDIVKTIAVVNSFNIWIKDTEIYIYVALEEDIVMAKKNPMGNNRVMMKFQSMLGGMIIHLHILQMKKDNKNPTII